MIVLVLECAKWIVRDKPTERKFLMTLKLVQLFRKSIWRHLWASVVNAVNLKEIKQVVSG